jgi:hypothetical protein
MLRASAEDSPGRRDSIGLFPAIADRVRIIEAQHARCGLRGGIRDGRPDDRASMHRSLAGYCARCCKGSGKRSMRL